MFNLIEDLDREFETESNEFKQRYLHFKLRLISELARISKEDFDLKFVNYDEETIQDILAFQNDEIKDHKNYKKVMQSLMIIIKKNKTNQKINDFFKQNKIKSSEDIKFEDAVVLSSGLEFKLSDIQKIISFSQVESEKIQQTEF